MKKILQKTFFLFLLIFLSVATVSFTSLALAQETPEEAASKHGVTFPVLELGNCSNVAECRTYCEDPVNQTACITFAKAKGFYKEELSQRQQELLNGAKTELGCTNIAGCQSLCHSQENFEKCNTFAKKYGVSGGHIEDPAKQQILQKAQETLGCTSYQSCKSFCEQEQNREKCDAFAQQVGLRGGETRHGPGGCTSEQTCRTFCSDPNNFQVCQGFSQGSGGRFRGPGGCDNEATCRAYCQQNQQECGYGGSRETSNYNPQEMCLRTPSCRWSNNTCECGFYNALESGKKAEEYAQFCREHPEQCQPGQLGGFVNSGDRHQFEQYCRENPDKCRMGFEHKAEVENCFRSGKYWYNNTCNDSSQTGQYGTPYPDGLYPSGPYPTWTGDKSQWEADCNKTPNCTWTGTTCQCTQPTGAYYAPQPNYSPYPTYSYNPAEECQKNSNCRWENNSCQCTSTSNINPTQPPQTNTAEQDCISRSGCRWESNTCKCESSSGSGSSGGTTGTSGESPEQMCTKTPGCQWTNNTCQCSQVQGTATSRNLIETIFSFLSNLFR